MPPKRKRAEATDGEATAAASSTRATRSSTRKTAAKSEEATTKKQPAKKPATKKSTKKKSVEEDEQEQAPVSKKAKTASKKSVANDSPAALDDEPATSSKANNAPAKHISQKPTKTTKLEPYTPAHSESLFAAYADQDQPDVIGAEGFEKLFTDANLPLDGALPVILSWQLDAEEMLKLTKDEWLKGTASLKISSLSALSTMLIDLENLLVLRKPSLNTTSKKEEPYDRKAYWGYANDKDAAFQKLYSYCFVLAKPPQSKNIEMETAVAFWSVLLVPQYPIMSDVLEFIAEKGSTYRAANKDLWSMMLEFCKTIKPSSLQDYEAEAAWPIILDDFVAWKKQKQQAEEE